MDKNASGNMTIPNSYVDEVNNMIKPSGRNFGFDQKEEKQKDKKEKDMK